MRNLLNSASESLLNAGRQFQIDANFGAASGIAEMLLQSHSGVIAILRGEQSILMPPEIGTYMFNLLGRSAPVVDIPQAQHHVMLDQPLALVAALRALLADWEHSHPRRKPA